MPALYIKEIAIISNITGKDFTQILWKLGPSYFETEMFTFRKFSVGKKVLNEVVGNPNYYVP